MRLFFSYSRSDTAFVYRLRQDLERAGHEVWLDRDDIPGGAAWRRSIGEGIAGADLVVVVVTPASVVSANVERELTVADEQAKRLLPVLAERAVIPPSLSFLLAGVQHVDFTTQRYPEALAELHQALSAAGASRSEAPAGATGGGAGGPPAADVVAPAGHGRGRGRGRSKPAWERGPSKTQLAIALALVVAVAAFLGGMVVSNRKTDPLAIGSFLGDSGCDGVVLVSGVMPKGSGKSGVKERMADTTAALQAAGVTNVPVRYVDGDKSCFASPGNWLVVSGPFAQANQAAALCSAIRGQGEFGADPSIPLSVRNVQASAACG